VLFFFNNVSGFSDSLPSIAVYPHFCHFFFALTSPDGGDFFFLAIGDFASLVFCFSLSDVASTFPSNLMMFLESPSNPLPPSYLGCSTASDNNLVSFLAFDFFYVPSCWGSSASAVSRVFFS